MTILLVILGLLICASATYNAYLLRGGKMALSEVSIALGMVSFVIAFVIRLAYPHLAVRAGVLVSDVVFILGFVLFLAASLQLRSSFKLKP